MRTLLISLISVWMVAIVQAQPHIRPEDHFWRRRVVNRIDLREKMNAPLVIHESSYYSANAKYSQSAGMVSSLIEGLKSGAYKAYHPEDWDHTLAYEDVQARMQEFSEALWGGNEDEGFEPFPGEETDDFEDPFADDPFAPVEETADPWFPDEQNDPNAYWETGLAEEKVTEQEAEIEEPVDLMPYEEVIHMVEDWVFDKNRSMMVQQIDYFEVIWVDPSGVLPEKVLARFLWKDVRKQLDDTQWKSRFNDSEARSIAEAFELRLFHGYPIDISGNPVLTLDEAEKRRQELIEFEHNLWSY